MERWKEFFARLIDEGFADEEIRKYLREALLDKGYPPDFFYRTVSPALKAPPPTFD